MMNKYLNFKSFWSFALLLLLVVSSVYVKADNNEGDDQDSSLYDGQNHYDDNEAPADRTKCCLDADTASASASYCSSNFNSNCLNQIQAACGTQPSKDCCKLLFRGQCRGQCELQHQACKCDRQHPCLSTSTTCIKGHCVCPPQETICGDDHSSNFGQCVFLNTTRNCGSCGVTCLAGSGEVCPNGECVCPRSTTLCSSVCTSTSTDNNNCGSCGNVCSGGEFCQAGACVCPLDQTFCNGACTLTNGFLTNVNNCGSCGNVCPNGPVNSQSTCSGGQCGFTCNVGFTLCNGACTLTNSFLTDVNNCGSCDNACPNGPANSQSTCAGGQCGFTCNAGFTLCSGACIATDDFLTDLNNCGSCGNVCANGPANSEPTCGAGQCGFSCDAGYSGANCDQTVCSTTPGICANGGTCQFSSTDPFYSCSCPPGSSGTNCEVTPCTSYPAICQNNGICSYSNSASPYYTCTCQPGFFGAQCGNFFNNITWTTHAGQPNDNFYPNISAQIGDEINFYYTKPHTVYQFPTLAAYAACNLAVATRVCGTVVTNVTTGAVSCNAPPGSNTSPCVITGANANCLVTLTSLPVYFGCNIGNHCSAQAMHIRAQQA